LTRILPLIFHSRYSKSIPVRYGLMHQGERIAEISFLGRSSNILRESGYYLDFEEEREEFNCEIQL
jgi:hypothetical protein